MRGGVDSAHGWMEGLLRSRSAAVLYRALAVQSSGSQLPLGQAFQDGSKES